MIDPSLAVHSSELQWSNLISQIYFDFSRQFHIASVCEFLLILCLFGLWISFAECLVAEDSEQKKKKELEFLLREALFSSLLNNQTWRGFWIARELIENLAGILIWTSLLIVVVVGHVEEISATKWTAITLFFVLG